MLVAEHRHGAAAAAELVSDFEKQLESRIQLLSLAIGWIVARFANQQDAVDGQLLASQRQRLGDRGENRNTIALGAFTAHVVLRTLRSVHRSDARVGTRLSIVLLVALQVFADNHI